MGKKKERRTPPAPAMPPTRLNSREQGMQAFNRGDYNGAILAWTNALRAAPSGVIERALAEAYFRRACLNWRKASEQVLSDLQNACDLLPGDAVYVYYRGLAHHRQGDTLEAVRLYRESVKLDPYTYARTAYMLCLALAESGDDPGADPVWELLTPAQRSRLQGDDSVLSGALAQLAAGDFEDAEEPLHRALAASRGIAHYYLGVIARQRGDAEEALARWLSARAAGFDTPALRKNLLAAYIERANAQADVPELADTVRAGLRLASDSPILLKLKYRAEFLAGNRAAESGDWRGALTHWQAAQRSAGTPPVRELLGNIALAYEQLERWTEAADAWRELLRRRPRRGENAWSPQHIAQLWRHVDSLYARAGMLNKSVAMLRYAIKAQPDDLALRLALVKRHMENQDWRGAQSAALRVLELAPGHPEAGALYAQALDMGNDLDLMIEAWEKVATTGDKQFVALARQRLVALYMERGDFYQSIDDHKAVMEDYARALALAPDDAALKARYGAMLTRLAPDQARAQFETLNLKDDTVALAIIGAWHRAGAHDEAARWLERRSKLKPLGTALLIELGVSVFESGPETAQSYFAKALEHPADGKGPHLLNLIAVAYAEHDKTAEAYEYARRALKLDPQFGPAHLSLGLWDAAKGRRQASRDHLHKALDWARRTRHTAIAEGIEEAINLLDERYVPTLAEILDTIDPDGLDLNMRRLMGSLAKQGDV
jgi:tetratricopeptide (TPR) repeat protein